MSAFANLLVEQGATFRISLQIFEDDDPKDLTGFTARSQLRRSHRSRRATDFTVEINNPTNGELMLSLTAEQTSILKAGRYVYDVEVVGPNFPPSEVGRILEGVVTVSPEATKVD